MGDNTPNSSTPVTSGALRTKISLKSNQIVTPFHTFKPDLPGKSEIQGSYDLLASYDLGGVYQRFCGPRRLQEDLASFLPHLYGNFNFSESQDSSSLKALVEKPPIHKEITNLSNSAMQAFRLSTGPVDERYRHLFEKRRDGADNQLIYDEKRDVIRIKNTLETMVFADESLNQAYRKKHKKKKSKKEKKKKRDDEEKEEAKPTPMEF